MNTKLIGICFLGNDPAITGNIFGGGNNRITFQISRPSLRTFLRKFTLPSLDADKSNPAIPLNVSTSAWNCTSSNYFSIVSRTSTGYFFRLIAIGPANIKDPASAKSAFIEGISQIPFSLLVIREKL